MPRQLTTEHQRQAGKARYRQMVYGYIDRYPGDPDRAAQALSGAMRLAFPFKFRKAVTREYILRYQEERKVVNASGQV